jgi:acyl-CoA dehydrogenase
MADIIWLLALLLITGAVFHRRLAPPLGTVIIAVALLIYTLAAEANPWWLITLWLLFAAGATFVHAEELRRRWVTDRIHALFSKMMPSLSETEREAIEAGSVWWDADLFSGMPDWRALLRYRHPHLSSEEEAFIDGPVEELCRMLDDYEINQQRNDLPPEVWRFLREKGFFGMIIPKAYGGLGFSPFAHSQVVMKIASRSGTAAVTAMVPNSLGPGELLLQYGTDEQKQHYLPRLARGEEIPCFALTGPQAGSDAGAMPDRGIVCKGRHEGKEVLGLRVSWEKRYITLAPVATLLGVAFRAYDPDHLLGESESLGPTLALIPSDHPGVEIGSRHQPLAAAFQNGPTRGDDVFIPLDWVIGGPERIGQGWRMLMSALAAGRGISLPSLSTGAAKVASRATGAYARIRRQFNQPIGYFEGVEAPLARIAGETYRMDSARRMTLAALNEGEHPAVISGLMKYELTEAMRRVVNDAMDVHGGKGIIMGPSNYLGQLYFDLPISITVEGANILTRSMIVFGQGAIRSHPYLLEEMLAAADDDRARGAQAFDAAFTRHLGYGLSNAVRTLWFGLTGARWGRVPLHQPLRWHLQQLSRASAAFALSADLTLLATGGDLKRREHLSGRLADILGHLYLASAVVRRFDEDRRPPEDVPLAQWALEDSLRRMQAAFDDLHRNLPQPLLGRALNRICFPWGRAWRGPDDALQHMAAKLLMQPSRTRRRLIDGIYLSDSAREPVGRIEDALHKVIKAERCERKLQRAYERRIDYSELGEVAEQARRQGLLSDQEAHAIWDAMEATARAIAVDDFPVKRRGAGAGEAGKAPSRSRAPARKSASKARSPSGAGNRTSSKKTARKDKPR